MKLQEIISKIEEWCPLDYQENYDNAGLIVGNPNMDISGALLCLDSTEEVLDEAIKLNLNLIISHHPIIFSGLKSITGKSYIERVIVKAIQNNIAIYSAHTNLDNLKLGVNNKIADKLGLINRQVLSPKTGILRKLYTYIPINDVEMVREALFKIGGGRIGNYSECSFNTSGIGTFKGNEESNPKIGEKGKLHQEPEMKVELIYPVHLENKMIQTLLDSHPYEEVAYEIITIENSNQEIGSGMIGDLVQPLSENEFLSHVKDKMGIKLIRHTSLLNRDIKSIAFCGGSGSFLLPHAIKYEADAFVSADFKYHQFFDSDRQILICDIGHYESEQYTQELFHSFLAEKFRNFAVHFSTVKTNPIKYF